MKIKLLCVTINAITGLAMIQRYNKLFVINIFLYFVNHFLIAQTRVCHQ